MVFIQGIEIMNSITQTCKVCGGTILPQGQYDGSTEMVCMQCGRIGGVQAIPIDPAAALPPIGHRALEPRTPSIRNRTEEKQLMLREREAQERTGNLKIGSRVGNHIYSVCQKCGTHWWRYMRRTRPEHPHHLCNDCWLVKRKKAGGFIGEEDVI